MHSLATDMHSLTLVHTTIYNSSRTLVFKIVYLFCLALCFQNASAEGGGGEVLQGFASILAAGAPAVVAGIQAGAEVDITRTNANAQIAMTNIQADVSRYQAKTQAEVSMFESLTAWGINRQNNEGQTERLQMMLRQQAYERQLARESEIEKRKIELEYNRQRIALAYREQDARYKAEMAKINAANVLAGTESPFQQTSSSLTTTPVGQTASVATAATNPAQNRALASVSGRKVLDRISQIGARSLASGSTRAVRKKGVSDLASFQATVQPSRAIASNVAGFTRHVRRDLSSQGFASHTSGRSEGVFRVGRPIAP